MRIMIVDDSAVMRKMIIRALSTSEFATADIVQAGDGEDALAKLKAAPVDIFLVDWNMPRMNGIVFVRKLRAFDRQAVVIMVTTETGTRNITEASGEEVDGYVGKPFDSIGLVSAMRRAFESKEARRAAQ